MTEQIETREELLEQAIGNTEERREAFLREIDRSPLKRGHNVAHVATLDNGAGNYQVYAWDDEGRCVMVNFLATTRKSTNPGSISLRLPLMDLFVPVAHVFQRENRLIYAVLTDGRILVYDTQRKGTWHHDHLNGICLEMAENKLLKKKQDLITEKLDRMTQAHERAQSARLAQQIALDRAMNLELEEEMRLKEERRNAGALAEASIETPTPDTRFEPKPPKERREENEAWLKKTGSRYI